MSFDKLYIVDKLSSVNYSNHKLHKLNYYGEIQTSFNMSLVCDGTKDSSQVIVFNNDRETLDPYTIVYLESTNTWWVSKKDKVMRYENEIGSYYKHTISLLGAFELLNARELTSCGFNANKYTTRQFFTRLFKLSSFEYEVDFENLTQYIDLDSTITYLKTFEDYTLESAIKEMFNGMNLTPKLDFEVFNYNNNKYVYKCYLNCCCRSGSKATPISINAFGDAEEQLSIDSESYGTRVVSKVQNCVSQNTIRYPTISGVKPTSDDATIIIRRHEGTSNAKIRLPNDIYEVKNIYIYMPFKLLYANGDETDYLNASNYEEFVNIINKLKWSSSTLVSEEKLKHIFYTYLLIKLKNGGYYNNYEDAFYGDYLFVDSGHAGSNYARFMLNSSNYAKTSKYNFDTISWEQGKDYIENLNIIDDNAVPNEYENRTTEVASGSGANSLFIRFEYTNAYNTLFAVEYVPMTDLVIKAENNKQFNDINLYNQNGKMVDSKAISKLINSHAIEVSSDEITRYGTYYDFNNVPKPSQIVNDGDTKYIINNVSIDFHENDDDGYYIEAQFTMTKNTACKSTMISANTNIRDYDCPQKNNIKRVQLYRDYIELGYTLEHSESSYKRDIYDLFNNYNGNRKGLPYNYTFVFQVLDDMLDPNFCYQLGTAKYEMNKQTIIVADFKDNNIIGYEVGNKYKPLQASTLFSSDQEAINTPVSYIDPSGDGSLNTLICRFVNENQLFNGYYQSNALGKLGKIVSFQYDTFSYWENNNYEIAINEANYDKDGLEVPVFEYCLQVGDANGIVFGEDFLKAVDKEKDNLNSYIYYYMKELNSNDYITQESAGLYMNDTNRRGTALSLDNNKLKIELEQGYYTTKGKNIIIWCEWLDSNNQLHKQFLLGLNNTPASYETEILLYINNWKLR